MLTVQKQNNTHKFLFSKGKYYSQILENNEKFNADIFNYINSFSPI